jgi:flagellar L-ring protein precursor FlgH
MHRIALTALIIFGLAGSAAADSLWSPGARSLFVDLKAAQPGDILTVLVVESVSASHKAAHDTSKSLSAKCPGGDGALKFFPDLSLTTTRETAGEGQNVTSTRITDRVAVKVTKVDERGNLTIEGKRSLKLGADTLELTFTGEVRKEDVNSDNTVFSSDVSGLTVSWTGKGPIAQDTKPGLIRLLLNFLW